MSSPSSLVQIIWTRAGSRGCRGVRLSLTAEYNSTSDSTRVQQCHDNNHVIFYLHVCMYTLTEF